MAQLYKINNKRYEFTNVDSAAVTAYTLTEADFNKWIKIDTTTTSVDIQMPDGLSEGFRCIVENTGVFTVNYINGVGTSLATQQDNLTEDQYRTVEIVFNNSEWRLQGYVGRNDISSLYDVNTDAQGVPNDGDVLQYDFNAGIWSSASQPPLFGRSAETIDFILAAEDHGKIIPVDTTVLPVDVALNLGLDSGFKVRLINVGTGDMTITAAPTLNIPTTTITGQYTFVDIFHAGLETYYGVIGTQSSTGGIFDYLKINSTGTEASASGTGAIALGENVTSTAAQTISIGTNSTASAIGAVALGNASSADGATSIAIGSSANASVDDAIAIGVSADASAAGAVAVGDGATSNASDAIQLGPGANSSIDTLQYLSRTIATSNGVKAFDIGGIPGGAADDGNLAVDTANDALYFYSTGAWHPAGAGGSFLGVNTVQAAPNLNASLEAIGLGGGVIAAASSDQSILIGDGAVSSGTFGTGQIVMLGADSQIVAGTSTSSGSIVIGQAAQVLNAQEGTSIGLAASVQATRGIAVGAGSDIFTNCTNSIAIGYNSVAQNSSASAIAIGSGADANAASNGIAVGTAATVSNLNAIAIGNATSASNSSTVAIGPNSSATQPDAIAIGNNADATANGAIQLGAGTNSTANSIQLESLLLATTDGIVLTDTAGAPVDTPAVRTCRFDDTTNILYVYNGSAWVSTTLT